MTPATSHGFAAVEFATDVLGIRLHPWQRWLLIHALELAPWGGFRFRTIIVLVGRQNGKTTTVEVKNLFKMFVLGVPLVLGTAQDLSTSEESWDHAVEMVEGVPELAAELDEVVRVNGKKTLKLKSGARWKVATASRRGGRGLSGDDINLDELREHHNWDSWSAITKTTMARIKAQVWGFSNAGDIRSVVLNELQAAGRAAVEDPADADPSLGLFEWSAPDDVMCTCARGDVAGVPHAAHCRLWDRQAWAAANPSLGYPDGVSELAIAAALTTDPDATFRTEVLCQRVITLAPQWTVIPEAAWDELVDRGSTMADPVVFAVDVNYEGTAAAIAAAGHRPDDDLIHIDQVDHYETVGWVVPRLVELRDKWRPLAVVLDRKGPAGALVPDLEAAGFEVVNPNEQAKRGRTPLVVPGVLDVGVAFERFVAEATEAPTRLRHRGQAGFADALAGATTRPLGASGSKTWAPKTSSADISPIVAAGLARWGLTVRQLRRRIPPAPPALARSGPAPRPSGGRAGAFDITRAGF